MRMEGPRVLSYPMRVEWAGFTSTTALLQQQGWEISAEQDILRNSLRICMRHRGCRLYALSELLDVDYHRAQYLSDAGGLGSLTLRVKFVASDIAINIMDNLSAFKPIDAMPQYTRREIQSIKDLAIFSVPMVRTNEILVDPTKIGEILELIQIAQLPEQEAIRKREQLRQRRVEFGRCLSENDFREEQTFHAQLVSVAA